MFLELIPAVHRTLQAVTSPTNYTDLGDWNRDGKTVTKASGFLYQLQSSSSPPFGVIYYLVEVLPNFRQWYAVFRLMCGGLLFAKKPGKTPDSCLQPQCGLQ